MMLTEALRDNVYRRLRKGRAGSHALYFAAASLYWLAKARTLYVGTRIVEIPWVLRQLRMLAHNGEKILQLGDVLLKDALANYKTTLVDLDAEENLRSGLEVYKSDIRGVSLPENSFDGAISISTLEHIGIMGPRFPDGDREAVTIIHKALKPRGWFLFTVPFGRPAVLEKMRIYDMKRLESILDGLFTITDAVFLVWSSFRWEVKSCEEAEQVNTMRNKPTVPNRGVALVRATKLG